MFDNYLKALERAELYNMLFGLIGVVGLLVFCMLPIVFIFYEFIGRYIIIVVIFMAVMIGIIVNWYINKVNKDPDYLDELTLKISVDINEMEIKFISHNGAIYYFRGSHTFFIGNNVDEKETIIYECYFQDGSNVMSDYMRSIKQKAIYPQMEVNINPSNYYQYYIDSKDYMRKLGNIL